MLETRLLRHQRESISDQLHFSFCPTLTDLHKIIILRTD